MDKKICEEFLSNMDRTLPMINNFRVALSQAILENWNSETKLFILSAIEEAYKKVEKC